MPPNPWGRLSLARAAAMVCVLASIPEPAAAQEPSRLFAGGLFGVSTLSADGRADTTDAAAALSLYKPENGPAINLFAGVHLARFFSIQANWMWNRNDLTLVSSFVTTQGGAYYEQHRRSSQHAAVLDGLVYFRQPQSAVRPYLGTGLAVLHFSSEPVASAARGLTPPPGRIAATRVGLRSHVGIDLRLSRRIRFRYSFSETISGNPISPTLTPPAPRRLANFVNLFGFVASLE